MKKEEQKKVKKEKYLRPVLTKHKKLREITAGITKIVLGCTR